MDDTVRCSQCGKEVEQGYIFSSRRISWTESGESIFMDDRSEVLVKDSFLKIHKTPAYRCDVCKLLTFRYE